jgi:hypothetical protein
MTLIVPTRILMYNIGLSEVYKLINWKQVEAPDLKNSLDCARHDKLTKEIK